jgi:hypothetical protein
LWRYFLRGYPLNARHECTRLWPYGMNDLAALLAWSKSRLVGRLSRAQIEARPQAPRFDL